MPSIDTGQFLWDQRQYCFIQYNNEEFEKPCYTLTYWRSRNMLIFESHLCYTHACCWAKTTNAQKPTDINGKPFVETFHMNDACIWTWSYLCFLDTSWFWQWAPELNGLWVIVYLQQTYIFLQSSEIKVPCKFASVGFQFFFLTSFAFMALEALQAYTVATNVISSHGYLNRLQSTVIGWGGSAIITSISVMLRHTDYTSFWS